MKPIIFNTDMVKALVDGRKTQTRRIIKPQPGNRGLRFTNRYEDWHGDEVKPKYMVGDKLWVREAWKPGAWEEDGRVAIDYKASPELLKTPWIEDFPKFDEYNEKWTDELVTNGCKPNEYGEFHWKYGKSPLAWKSPIHMPRVASRITLEITNVRIERLQDISMADAIDEGILSCKNNSSTGLAFYDYSGKTTAESFNFSQPISSFKTLWNSIYPDGWQENPWVWVYEFKVTYK